MATIVFDDSSANTSTISSETVTTSGVVASSTGNLVILFNFYGCIAGSYPPVISATSPADLSDPLDEQFLYDDSPNPGYWRRTFVSQTCAFFDTVKLDSGSTGDITTTISPQAKHGVIAATFSITEGTSQTVEVNLVDYCISQELMESDDYLLNNEIITTSDNTLDETYTLYIQSLQASEQLKSTSVTSSYIASNLALKDIIKAIFFNLQNESITTLESYVTLQATYLVDFLNLAQVYAPTYINVITVADLLLHKELYNTADGYDVIDASTISDEYLNKVNALIAILEQLQLIPLNTVVVHIFQSAGDIIDNTDNISSAGSIINNILTDTIFAYIKLNIGGELYTGWVLNTDSLAPSEYQFIDLQFNSACNHNDKYLLAAEDGIYTFAQPEENDVESVMTYLKTGKLDFGIDLQKRIVNSYIAYSATGQMVLKVTTVEHGKLQTRNYKMVEAKPSEGTDTKRFDIGKGIRSRYWQFEIVGDGVDCDIDEIGILPIVLSRRI